MTQDAADLRARLDADRKDLLDLSRRNPLINQRPRSRSVELVEASPRELFRALVVEGKALPFVPAADPGPPAPEAAPEPEPEAGPEVPVESPTRLRAATPGVDLQGRLLAIYYAARTSLEEQGVNTLFLGSGPQWLDLITAWHVYEGANS